MRMLLRRDAMLVRLIRWTVCLVVAAERALEGTGSLLLGVQVDFDDKCWSFELDGRLVHL